MIKPDTNYNRDDFLKAIKELREMYSLDDGRTDWAIAKEYFVGKFNSREEFAQYWAEKFANYSFAPYDFLDDCINYRVLAMYLFEHSGYTRELGDNYVYINGFVFGEV